MGSSSARFAHHPLPYASGSTQPLLDGPALRSTALITYANWLLVQGNFSFVKDTMWPVIQRDLDYVATEWNQSTYVNSQKTSSILMRSQHNSAVLTSGRKCIHLPSLQRLYNTGPFARVRPLRHNLARVPPLTRTTPKLPISSVSSRYQGHLMLFWARSHCTRRPIGTPQEVTSRPIREAVGPGRTQTLFSHRSTHGISMRDVMRLPSSRVQTRHCPT